MLTPVQILDASYSNENEQKEDNQRKNRIESSLAPGYNGAEVMK